jgi:hypothetical protein
MYSSPRSSGSPSYKKSSLIHVCKLKRLTNGKFKVEAIEGAEKRHEKFMWRFFSTLNHQTSHSGSGVSRQDINDVLLYLYPNRKYRTYYNSIISVTIRPKRLF